MLYVTQTTHLGHFSAWKAEDEQEFIRVAESALSHDENFSYRHFSTYFDAIDHLHSITDVFTKKATIAVYIRSDDMYYSCYQPKEGTADLVFFSHEGEDGFSAGQYNYWARSYDSLFKSMNIYTDKGLAALEVRSNVVSDDLYHYIIRDLDIPKDILKEHKT